ncbi:hypothetical protein GSI_03638 [Ganoderma sinense ZZ0214-1]|uniref:BTB domain-containing protein n=1 Tax=Ganoderma sinense ZZ0214-1 TaxID=1077348 RepID=A0A2G8SJI8_9APHY|nr:hypothetical protein GSI_03638 [Ganoderma sinense ZZ0214-1]
MAEAHTPPAVASGPTRKAMPPFDREDADFIIRSRDNVDFYVFRAILMLASTVFEGMLPIPQPPPAESSSGRGDHKPVVSVSEENHIMDTFLRVVYPLTTPQTTSLFHVREVLEAGLKYDASAVVNEMRMALTKPRFLAKDPLQVFSIAYNCRFEDETRTAAAHAVAQGHLGHIDAHLSDLASVTAGAYYRLMQLHRNHMQTALQSTGKDDRLSMPTFDGIGSFCREAPLPSQSRGGTIPSVLAPFTDPRADVVIKSRDGRKFRVHRAIIDAASPTLLGALLTEDSPDPSISRKGGTPTTTVSYRMPENSAVVDALLRLCYPGPRPRFAPESEPPAHFLAVLAALQEYALLAPAADLVHAHWAAYASREPFRFFFHAIARGLGREAHVCAQLVACSASGPVDMHALYVPEMEGVGALAYHRLLAYITAYRGAALYSAHACTWGPELEPTPNPKAEPKDPTVYLGWGGCVEGAQCICANGALAKISSGTLPPALLEMLAGKLRCEPRGGVLLSDHALVAALAEAAHNAICAPESVDYQPPSFLQLLLAIAIGWWCWSLPLAVVVALGMGRIQVGCGCPKAKHIPWAEARLREIARRVDEAVSQVKLDLSGVL